MGGWGLGNPYGVRIVKIVRFIGRSLIELKEVSYCGLSEVVDCFYTTKLELNGKKSLHYLSNSHHASSEQDSGSLHIIHEEQHIGRNLLYVSEAC